MALKTFVLISSVNNLSDARYCAGMDVDLIGFSFEENQPNYISETVYKELTEWLSGVDFVGEFQSSTVDFIGEKMSAYGTKYVEVSDASLVSGLKEAGFTVLLRLNLSDVVSDDAYPADYLVLEDDVDEISDQQIEQIRMLSKHNQVLLGFGINDHNVERLLQATNAHGIALTGGNEIKPGYKDYDELADILETLEVDDLA